MLRPVQSNHLSLVVFFPVTVTLWGREQLGCVCAVKRSQTWPESINFEEKKSDSWTLRRVRNLFPPLNSVDLTKLVWGRSNKIDVTPPTPGAVLRSRRGSERILSVERKIGVVSLDWEIFRICSFGYIDWISFPSLRHGNFAYSFFSFAMQCRIKLMHAARAAAVLLRLHWRKCRLPCSVSDTRSKTWISSWCTAIAKVSIYFLRFKI
jgi:hypothetical protein